MFWEAESLILPGSLCGQNRLCKKVEDFGRKEDQTTLSCFCFSWVQVARLLQIRLLGPREAGGVTTPSLQGLGGGQSGKRTNAALIDFLNVARWGSWKWQAARLLVDPPNSRADIWTENLWGFLNEGEVTNSHHMVTRSSLGKEYSLDGGMFSKNFESNDFLGFERRKCDLADTAVQWICTWLKGCPGHWMELTSPPERSPAICLRAVFSHPLWILFKAASRMLNNLNWLECRN